MTALSQYMEDTYNLTLPSASYSYSSSTSSASSGWFNNFLGDVYGMLGLVFGFGLVVSTFVAFSYLYALRLPGLLFIVIWGIMLSVQAVLIVGSFLLWSLATNWQKDGVHSSAEYLTMKVFAYVGMGISFLYFCLLLVMRKRVQLAIGVVKEAAKALASMPLLLAMPVIQVVGVSLFLVPWCIYVLYLASSGEMKNVVGHSNSMLADAALASNNPNAQLIASLTNQTYTYREFEFTVDTKYAFLYMLFCWFWTSGFVVAIGQLVIALSFSGWYFSKDKATVGNNTVLWAFKTAFRYHAGTAAFGSLVIAIIQTIRAVIAYFQKQAKAHKNKLMEYLLCCLQCCMWCLEKIMKFINKNAYIQVAIHGHSYCKAARVAFFLILRNILRVFAVNMVAEFVLFLGKMFVPCVTVFLCYIVMAYGVDSSQISGIIAPLVMVFILSYFIAQMFSELYSMGIESILCCFIADEEMFPAGSRFAEGALAETMKSAETGKAISGPEVHPE